MKYFKQGDIVVPIKGIKIDTWDEGVDFTKLKEAKIMEYDGGDKTVHIRATKGHIIYRNEKDSTIWASVNSFKLASSNIQQSQYEIF